MQKEGRSAIRPCAVVRDVEDALAVDMDVHAGFDDRLASRREHLLDGLLEGAPVEEDLAAPEDSRRAASLADVEV